jgi:mono/diheme cytochrome c family protein
MTANHPQGLAPDEARMSDEALLTEHEKLTGPQPDEHARYRLLPLAMILVLSACVLFAATYLNRYSGHFSASIYNENLLPTKGAAAAIKVDPVAFGDKLYHSAGACITCHQPTGQGIPGVYPPLAGSEWVNGAEDRAIRIVLYGLQGPVHVAGKDFGSAAMPVFGQVANSGYNWSDEKVAAVLTFVRQEWGNKAPAVSADKVAAIRRAVGDRPSWSQDELLKIK